MSPIATMMTTSMMLATRNRGPASHRRRHARAADQNSRTHTAQIRQATVRRRNECMRRQRVLARASAEQASAEQSGRDTSDEPIVMAYPVLFDSGDATGRCCHWPSHPSAHVQRSATAAVTGCRLPVEVTGCHLTSRGRRIWQRPKKLVLRRRRVISLPRVTAPRDVGADAGKVG